MFSFYAIFTKKTTYLIPMIMKNILLSTLFALITTLGFSQAPSYVPANGLVAYYPLDGNGNDLSGNSNALVPNGLLSYTQNNLGNPNSSCHFPNGNDYFLTPSSSWSLINNFPQGSVSFWVKIDSQYVSGHYFGIGNSFIVKQKHGVGEDLFFGMQDGTTKIRMQLTGVFPAPGGIDIIGNTSLIPNSWYHVIGTWNGVQHSLYVNGIIDGQINNSNGISNQPLPDYFSIGSILYGGNGTTSFPSGAYGAMDDIGIWNRPLTECEIQNLYTSTNPTNTTAASACNSYTWNGQTYTQSGIYTGITTDCVTQSLNLTITPSSTNTTSASACDSYSWNGQTYSTSGVYTGTTTNCVTESLNLTITPSSTNTTTATSCDSYTWNGTTYTTSGVYTGPTANCITESLNLTITPSSTNTTTASACDNYTWNGQTYTQSGVYTGTTANCVTESLNLTITPSSTNTTTAAACDSYAWNGQTYTSSGVYAGNTANCVTESLNLTITPSSTNTTTASACNSYVWNGTSYSASGVYTGTTANCVTQALNLTINPSTSSSISQTALDSYTWPVNNQSYTTSGAYTAVIPNAAGCDSTITLNLTMSFTGINDINASKISIYPNPTNGDFTITGLELVGTVSSLSLTDMNGKVVKVLDTKATKFTMASIKPGVYFLNIRADNKQEVLKIVKE